MKTFLVIFCAVFLFFSVFYVHGSVEKLRHDFKYHWHYTPSFVPDFKFERIRIFNDEGIPYQLTPYKKKKAPEFWNYVYCYTWR